MVVVVDDFDSGFVDFGCGGGMMFDFFFFCGFDGCGGGDGGCCGTVFDFFFPMDLVVSGGGGGGDCGCGGW